MATDISGPATGQVGIVGKITGAWWFGPGLIVCASLAYYLSYYLHFIDMVDEGLLVNGALRLLDGQQPVTEFWAYPPGRYALLAGAFKCLGIHLTSERYLLVALLVVRNVLVYLVARRLLPAVATITITLTLMLVPGPWHKVFYSLPLFAHLLLLLCYIDKPTTRRAAYCGAVSGLILYFRQDMAVYALLTVSFVIVAVRVVGLGSPGLLKNVTGLTHNLRVLRHLATSAACAALVLIPAILYYAPNLDIELLINRLGSDPVRAAEVVYQKNNLTPIWRLPEMLAGSTGGWMNYRFLNAWFPWVLYLGLGVAVSVGLYTVWRWFRGQKIDTRRAVMYAALLAWSALSMVRQIKLPSAKTCFITGPGMMIVIVALLVTMWAWARRGGEDESCRGLVLPDWPRAVRWLLTIPFTAVVLLTWSWLLLLALIPVPRVPAGSASCLFEANTPLVLQRAELVLPEAQANALRNVVEQIQLRTREDEPIFAYRQAMFYFLADRPNPTGFDNIVPPIVLPGIAREITEVVGHLNPPALQVLDLSESWTNAILNRYPDYLRTALFTDFETTYRFEDYVLLEPSPGSDAWEQIQPLWLHRKRESNSP